MKYYPVILTLACLIAELTFIYFLKCEADSVALPGEIKMQLK